MTLQPGTRLGPYQIVSALGAGGMGEVYRAEDTPLDRLSADCSCCTLTSMLSQAVESGPPTAALNRFPTAIQFRNGITGGKPTPRAGFSLARLRLHSSPQAHKVRLRAGASVPG
jgi:serine/threonine protein kinase